MSNKIFKFLKIRDLLIIILKLNFFKKVITAIENFFNKDS